MKYKFLCCFILLIIVLSPMTLAYSTSYSWSVLNSTIETSAQSSPTIQNDNFLNLDAESAILIEQNSGQILYSHNINFYTIFLYLIFDPFDSITPLYQ